MNQPVGRAPFPDLTSINNLFIHQRHELAEFIGFETRNKYEIVNSTGQPVAFAAEQGRGFLGLIMRSFLGHWRTFEIHFFNSARELILTARHPFRFFFQRLEVYDSQEKFLGAIAQRFALLSKRFEVQNESGQVIMEISSPIWKPWTFPFRRSGRDLAFVRKKWSGGISEFLTDRDNFLVEYTDSQLTQAERLLVLASGLFIDLQYFERKAD